MRSEGLAAAMRAALAAAVLVLVAFGPSAPVLAQEAVRARFFDDAARAAYARGDYEAALADFFEVARAAPTQGTLYNIAICADLTHRDALAYESLERYLAGPPEDETRSADARRRLAAIEARVALVRVQSTPPGATVWVDRRELGAYGTTPRTLVLAPGTHAVTLSHPGAEEVSREVRAELGAPTELDVELALRMGELRVVVEGAVGASVEAVAEEGPAREVSSLVPGAVSRVPVGTYRVRVRAAGHREASLRVGVQEGRLEERTVTLEPVPRPTGALAVRSDVEALVRIDGVERARTPARVPSLEVGSHHVELEAPGHLTWEADVEVSADHVRVLSVTMPDAPR